MGRPALDLRSLRGLILAGLAMGAALAAVMTAWELAKRLPVSRPAAPVRPPAAAEAAPPEDLRSRGLEFPVAGIPRMVTNSFDEPRRGARLHHAVDIMAPRGSPVRAVDEGTIVKLTSGGAGGTSVYEYDAGERYCYYYAHLQGYAAGLREGEKVSRGEVIGYVGTSGNAPANAPHLHFAIFRLDDQKRWWTGAPVNPYPLLH